MTTQNPPNDRRDEGPGDDSGDNRGAGAASTRFPDAVITAMHHAGTTVTCLPVQIESGTWESALFFVLPPAVTEAQISEVFVSNRMFPVELDADVREHDNGTLIELGVEIDIGLQEKLKGLVLFLTGHLTSHYEAVQYLGTQESLGLFIGDVHCNLLHQQRIPLAEQHRAVFDEMLKEVVKRDALIRLTGKYDPDLVFSSVVEEQQT